MDAFFEVQLFVACFALQCVHATHCFVQAASASMARRSLKHFMRVAAVQTREFYNDFANREALFESGLMSAALAVLGVQHGLPALDAAFKTPAESPAVRLLFFS
jgi:hypothetical protein